MRDIIKPSSRFGRSSLQNINHPSGPSAICGYCQVIISSYAVLASAVLSFCIVSLLFFSLKNLFFSGTTWIHSKNTVTMKYGLPSREHIYEKRWVLPVTTFWVKLEVAEYPCICVRLIENRTSYQENKTLDGSVSFVLHFKTAKTKTTCRIYFFNLSVCIFLESFTFLV